MVSSRLAWVALGVGAYLAFLVTTFPAAAAIHWFAPATLGIAQPSGTVWSGSARSVAVPGFILSDVGWTLDFVPLMLGRVSGDVDARLPDGFVRAGFTLRSGQRVDLNGLQLTTSLQALRDLLPVYDARGGISASIDELRIQDGLPVLVTGEIRLGNLEVAPLLQGRGQPLVALGTYRAVFVDSGEPGAFAQLEDTGGPIELHGSLALSPDGSYLLEGRVRARDGAPADLVQGIELMTGEPDAEGLRSLTFAGSL